MRNALFCLLDNEQVAMAFLTDLSREVDEFVNQVRLSIH